MNLYSFCALSLLCGLAASGCSKPEPRAPSPVAARPDQRTGVTVEVAPEQKRAVEEAAKQNQGGGLRFSQDIQDLCPGIESPKFGFDSSSLRDDWSRALGKLAECMKSGKLSGKSLLLTGHTDPRGDDEYNMDLGGRRAEAVRDAISAFGVEGARFSVTSRGEVDASGSDEESWAQDRRVDIDLLRPASGNGVSAKLTPWTAPPRRR